MSGVHAQLAASSAFRWGGDKGCRASIKQSHGKVNRSNLASRKGSAAHLVAATCLKQVTEPTAYLGRKVVFYAEIDDPNTELEALSDTVDVAGKIVAYEHTLDQTDIDIVTTYVDYINEQVRIHGGTLYVEQKLSIAHITGEPDAEGTADAVLVGQGWIRVYDLKGGSGRVNAYTVVKPAEIDLITDEVITPAVLDPNAQLGTYSDAAVVAFDLFGDVQTVTMTIIQPRLNHVSEHTMSVADLKAFIAKLSKAALETMADDPVYNPTTDNCFHCPGRFDCEARESKVLAAVVADFPDLSEPKSRPVSDDELGAMYTILPMVRRWADDVEDRMMSALDNGKTVVSADGVPYKLVTGKKGNRQWSDEAQVKALVEEMRLHGVMFKESLITPTQAEKLVGERKRRNSDVEPEKAPIGPGKWKRLEELITQAEGKAEIALATDPRPARHVVEPEIDLFS